MDENSVKIEPEEFIDLLKYANGDVAAILKFPQYRGKQIIIDGDLNLNGDRDIIIIVKEDKFYFPIYFIQKNDDKQSKFSIIKKFTNEKRFQNILDEFKKYFHISCSNLVMNQLIKNNNLITKNIITKIKINKQYIDERNKCKYVDIDGLAIPVKPSGISYNYDIDSIKNINLLSLDDTIDQLIKINKVLDLDYKPKIILYDYKDDDKIHIISILLDNSLIINIKPTLINQNKIIGYPTKLYSNTEIIDIAIQKNTNNDNDNDNIHIGNVKNYDYYNESYNLYRLELSLYLSQHTKIKNEIISIVRSTKINKHDKKIELRKILLSLINKKLGSDYKVSEDFAFIVNKLPDMKNYVLNNVRDYCKINTTEKKCSLNLHCLWKDNTCKINVQFES
jgi:hypothetical protein